MKNRKMNKALYSAVVFYIFMAGDILLNSYVANKWFLGVPQIWPSIRLGVFVINTISVPAAFLLGTIFLLTGLKINKRKKADVAAKR